MAFTTSGTYGFSASISPVPSAAAALRVMQQDFHRNT